MRTNSWLIAAMTIAFLGLLTACTNDGDPLLPDNPTQTLSSAQWRVSYFWDKDKDETSKFNGYTFAFKAGGAFEATQNGTVTTGTWEVRSSSSSSQKLVIQIGTDKPLIELDDDWIILEMNDQEIRLRDDNTEHLEELHFKAI
jgi:hypothetical protein